MSDTRSADGTKVFSSEPIEKLRRRIQLAADARVDAPPGWSKSGIEPAALLAAFKPLRLRPDVVLRAYQYVSGEDRNSVVYAMPREAPFPDPESCVFREDSFLHPPVPETADRSVMRYIESNGSPRSYLLASIFARELLEFGAKRHGCAWSFERITGRPVVRVSAAHVVVTFTTRSTEDGQILLHTDRYQLGSYSFVTDCIVQQRT